MRWLSAGSLQKWGRLYCACPLAPVHTPSSACWGSGAWCIQLPYKERGLRNRRHKPQNHEPRAWFTLGSLGLGQHLTQSKCSIIFNKQGVKNEKECQPSSQVAFFPELKSKNRQLRLLRFYVHAINWKSCSGSVSLGCNQKCYISFFFQKIVLGYSCFTMLYQLLLYIRVIQLYIYMYLLFLRSSSYLSHHRALSRVPCAIRQVLISCLFYMQQCIYVSPNLPIHATPSPPLGNYKFVSYLYDSISALQLSSSVPFVQIPHISNIIRYLYFSF